MSATRSLVTHAPPCLAAIGAVLISAIVCAPVTAQTAKTDVVVLTNGDHLTGEIKGLSRGRLSLDMSATTGVISIKWDRVASLTTTSRFEVETSDGAHLLGTLSPAGTGKLLVTEAGRVPHTLDIRSIIGLVPIHGSFFRRLDGSIDVGGSYTQSSGVAQVYFNLLTAARRPAFEWRATFDDYVTFKSEGATTEQLTGSLGYARYLSGRWAIFGQGQVERNPDLGFDLRGTLVGGVEWTLAQSNRSETIVAAGLGGARERPVEGETETQLPAAVAFRQSLFIYDTPKTTLDTRFAAYPILNQWGRWRIKADASLKREIFKDFTIGLTVYESFDSRPSSPDASRNDAGATLTIGYVF